MSFQSDVSAVYWMQLQYKEFYACVSMNDLRICMPMNISVVQSQLVLPHCGECRNEMPSKCLMDENIRIYFLINCTAYKIKKNDEYNPILFYFAIFCDGDLKLFNQPLMSPMFLCWC